jgi:hypothetical protein
VAIALSVVVDPMAIGLVQAGVEPDGVEPSCVQRITAPGVVLDIVTFWAEVYVPPAGEKVGVAACGRAGLIVYAAVATALSVYPLAVAIAWRVFVVETATALAHVGDEAVGVEPSCVQWMTAPGVVLEIVTFWAEVYVPPPGENVGVAAMGSLIPPPSLLLPPPLQAHAAATIGIQTSFRMRRAV